MTGKLHYNPLLMLWEIIPIFPELTDAKKEKVCLIEDLNKVQLCLVGQPLSPSQFDTFYELDNNLLHNMVQDQQSVLYRNKLGKS